MKRKKKKKSGCRISGSLEPFMVDALQSVWYGIISSGKVVTPQQLHIFRENSKIAVALRMRQAVDMKSANEQISHQSLGIIAAYLNGHQHTADVGFVNCTLQYFSRRRQHNISLNLNCSCCKSRELEKSLAHARMDCLKYSKHYVGRILRELKEDPWTNLDIDEIRVFCKQYQSIDYSIKFVCAYLKEICTGKLPNELGTTVFTTACNYDPAIANHYELNAGLGIYKLVPKRNHSLTTVSQECATFIFCMSLKKL